MSPARCGLCGAGTAEGRLAFVAPIPATPHVPSRPTKGVLDAHTVTVHLNLCERCTRRAYKHLKRMLRRAHFAVTAPHAA